MPENNNNSLPGQADFFAGSGDMGMLIRSKDWGETTLGKMSEWPQSLKTTLSIVLNSSSPMALFWGEELHCFYNDAFSPSLESAGKHPAGLGGKAPDVWAGRWSAMKPSMDQALGGVAASVEDQLVELYHNGKRENVYWTFTFNPVKGETGAIAGVLVICQDTTESVLSDEREKIEEKNIRLRNLLEHAPVAMTLLRGPEFIIQLANQKALELWGRSASEVIGLPAFTALPEVVEQGIAEILEEVYKTGKPFVANEYPVTLVRMGKSELLYINFIYEPLRNDAGIIEGIVGVGVDVSEQVHARKKVEESEQQLKRFKHMADNATEPFILMRKDGSFAYLNDLALQRWGYEREEIRHLRVPDVDPIYQEEKFNEVFAAAQQGQIPQFETLHKRKDGTVYPVEINMGGLVLEGEPHMFAVARDITERKKNETVLAESRERLQMALNASASGTFRWNITTNKLTWEGNLNRLFGLPVGETVQSLEEFINMVHPDDRSRVVERYKRCVSELVDFDLEFRIIGQDGSLHWLDEKGKTFTDKAGRPLYMTGACVDITERKRAEAIINGQKDALEQSVHGKPLHTVLETIVKTAESQSDNQLIASILLADREGKTLVHGAAPSLEPSYNDAVNGIEIGPGQGSCGTAAYIREEVVVADIANDPLWENYRELAQDHGLYACWSTPIIDAKGGLLGTFAVYYSSIRVPSPEERRAIGLLSSTAGIVIKWYQDIQTKKETERTLSASEERFRALVNATSDVVYRMSPDWREMLAMHGRGFVLDTGEPIKEWLKKYIPPDDYGQVRKALRQAIEAKQAFELEHRVVQKDGRLGWAFSRAVPILNEKQEVVEWFGAATDITKRKQAEAELRIARDESERMKRLYEAITGSTPDLLYVFDLNYRFTYANEALLGMWGQRWENAIGKGLLELGYEPWHAEMHEREIDQVVATKLPIRGEVAFPHATLGKRIYDYIFVPVINKEGEVEAVAGTTRDITELKTIEQSLKESEEKFRTMADTIPNLAWMADADGWIYWYNSRWYEYTGTTPDQMEGWGWQSVHDPQVLPLVLEKWKKSIATGELFDMVFPLKGADGKYRPFLTRIVPVKDEHGKVLKWFGTNTDITDREKLAKQKDEFIGIASHELKTPLTSVKGYIQLIRELVREGSFEMVGDLVESSERSVNKLTTLINDLLDVSKIQAGKIQYEFSEFPLLEILEDSIRETRYLSSRHEIIVEGDTSLKIHGDKLRLEQVVTNFLSNAIKYSPDADKILLTVEKEGNKLKVAVTDFGIGIAKKDLSNLFQRFFRTDQSAHQFQGLGLGLYISAEIIKRHNGDIGVTSTLGEGSTFYFIIPIKRRVG